MRRRTWWLLAGVIVLSSCRNDAVVPTGQPQPPYFPQVKTIIADNCLGCHSSSGSWSGRPVAFDTDDDIVNLAESIKRAVADPATPMNPRMPQGGTLSQKEIDIIVAWYNAGGLATN